MDSSTFFSQMALDLHDEPTAERTIERIAEFARIATGLASRITTALRTIGPS